ncbi:uncharacterized protein A1O5_07643 [Cladophialophora psammophila CBS 110553]|uniref:Uncharacterized protein n=1 Tax=Cladophialophora psammophila CBS 110553 TaxID=1182543 RepID=W9WN41_9EURO|nr:uncharacterized protein A1O5_07643 [Cladophialophora psammophila CBS 110553]EXJ69607.1 hypothetical protein A1O5_07643 [Cladophialophora psammophila CBS 110553]
MESRDKTVENPNSARPTSIVTTWHKAPSGGNLARLGSPSPTSDGMSTYLRAATASRICITAVPGTPHRVHGVFHCRDVPLGYPSSLPRGVATTVDQTKNNNDPNLGKRGEHVKAGKSATSSEGRGHPAKQPDPQEPPKRSSGFETQGPDGKSGEGEDTGGVHKEKKPELT